MSARVRVACIVISATVLLSQGLCAQGAAPTTVDFAPAVRAQLHKDFGTREADVLRSAILAALSKEERRDALPDGLTVKVTVRELMPTHPTMKQQLDNPSLSPVRTRYLGGADLVGELLDSQQQVLATVDYRNFADVLPAGAPSLDAWADARQSIDAFAAKLAASWEKLPKVRS
jgi:hypothetical protein